MKICLKNYIFSGGAPRSMLEYALILEKNGNQVFSIGEKVTNEVYLTYQQNGIKAYDVKRIEIRNIFKDSLSLLKNYRLTLKENPDLIISVAAGYEACISALIGRLLEIPVIIVVAGGPPLGRRLLSDLWGGNHVICFSYENKEDLISDGYNHKLIEVVSNRIYAEPDINWAAKYHRLTSDKEKITMLFVSRFDQGKLGSIDQTLLLLEKILLHEKNIELRIAGNGAFFNDYINKVEQINKRHGREVVKLLGHINDMRGEYAKADIVFGKSRSVLEPLLMNRIAFVVGEDHKVGLCNKANFNNLYHYNFGGRNLENYYTDDEIVQFIRAIRNGEIELTEYGDIFETIREHYHIKNLEPRLMSIVNSNYYEERRESNRHNSLNYFFLILGLIKVYINKIAIKLHQRNEDKHG